MIKCVVPISGGKDSQACLKLAIQKFDKSEIVGLFCDTKFEHPLTYAHVDKIEKIYGVRIERINAGDVPSLVRKYKRFPSDAARFCTDELKIKPSKIFYKKLAQEQSSGFEVWYGMRTDESNSRANRYRFNVGDECYSPHEMMPSKYPKYLAKLGILFRLPIIDWSERDVFDFLHKDLNPLYNLGMNRVGCFPCLASGDHAKEKAFALDDIGKHRRSEVVQLGKEINKNVFTTKGGILRNRDTMIRMINEDQPDLFDAPCMMCRI